MDEWPKERWFVWMQEQKVFVPCEKPDSTYDLTLNHSTRAIYHNGEVFRYELVYPHDILRAAAEAAGEEHG